MPEDINKIRNDPDFQSLNPKDRLDMLVDLGRSDSEIDAIMTGKPMIGSVPDPTAFNIKDVPGGGALSYAGDVLKNLPGSALRLAGNIATAPITVPMAFGRAVYDVGKAAMGDTGPLGETAAAIGGHFKQRYGGLSNIAETIRTDPVGAVADVGSVVAPVIGKVPVPQLNMGRLGKVPRSQLTVSELDPSRLAGSAAAGAVEMTGKRLQAAGVKTYQRALKPPISPERGLQGIADATRAAETGLLERILPSTKIPKVTLAEQAAKAGLRPQDLRHIPPAVRSDAIDKIAILEGKAHKELTGIITDLNAQGFKLDRAGKRQLVDQAVEYVKGKHQGATADVHQTIDDLGTLEKSSALPVPGQPGAFISDEMTPPMMQSRKQELRAGLVYGKEPGKTQPSALEDELNKSVAHGLAQQIEQWAPEAAKANLKLGDDKLLMEAMVDFVRRNRSAPPPTRTQIGWAAARTTGAGLAAAGLGTMAGGLSVGAGTGAMGILAALAYSQPAVKARLAILLHRAGRAAEGAGAAGRSAIMTRGVPEALTAGQRILVEPQRETSKSGRGIVSRDGGATWEYE